MKFGRLSRYVVVVFTVVLSGWFALTYGTMRGSFYSDGLGYYLYLPATFIYHNFNSIAEYPKDKGIDKMIFHYADVMKAEAARGTNGRVINQYTYGVALMEMPFFLVAHAYERSKGLAANGFSLPYDYMIKLSAVVYAWLGLMLVYRILRNYYDEWVSLITTVLVFVGTNLFWFTLDQAGMSHVPLFFLYAALVLLTIRVHETPKLYRFVLMGLVAGMITIIRPSDIICLLIPVLYGVYSKETVKVKLQFIVANKAKIAVAAIAFVVPIVPQMVYWKALTGNFIFYSYGAQSFDWLHPHIADGLLGGGNGWLPYSPVMVFALLGLVCYRYIKSWAWCLWGILPLYIYIIYSWYCYNYISGLGSRPMIHMYPLLAVPMAAVMQYISTRKMVWKFCFSLVAVFCVAVNISFSMQQQMGVLHSEDSNLSYDWQMLFRMHPGYNDLVVCDIDKFQPDAGKLVKLKTLACTNYEDSVSNHFVRDSSRASKYVYQMRGDEFPAGIIKLKYSKQLFADAKWFKCSGRFMVPQPPGLYSHLFVINVERDHQSLLWKAIKIENKIGIADESCKHDMLRLDHFEQGKWGYVYYYIRIPDEIQDGDDVSLFVWNVGKQDISIDDICLELYK